MIISLTTHKGGTGKTTTAINLSAALAQKHGQKTLLVDVDPQGHSTLGLGIDLAYQDPNIADLFSERMKAADLIKNTYIPNLDILPSNPRMAKVAETLYAAIRREEILMRGLTPVKRDYSWVLLDCPPSLGVLTINATFASDLVIIPCDMGIRSIDGLADLLDVLNKVKGCDFQNYRILLTMVDHRKRDTTNKIILDKLQGYKEKLCSTQIVVNEALNQAQMARRSIFDFEPNSRGAQSYLQLAKELSGYG